MKGFNTVTVAFKIVFTILKLQNLALDKAQGFKVRGQFAQNDFFSDDITVNVTF